MKTLLYLASGKYYPEYAALPFDRLIFVDRSQGYAKSYPENNPQIRFIVADALRAIDMLKQEEVKVDCLVSVNEGLDEGGGNYPIFSGFLMGYLSPLLHDTFTLVCNLNNYKSKYKILNKLDWGFKKLKKNRARNGRVYRPGSIFVCSTSIGKCKFRKCVLNAKRPLRNIIEYSKFFYTG
jgi:hypothetical protein